jgi:hypothetical protein
MEVQHGLGSLAENAVQVSPRRALASVNPIPACMIVNATLPQSGVSFLVMPGLTQPGCKKYQEEAGLYIELASISRMSAESLFLQWLSSRWIRNSIE